MIGCTIYPGLTKSQTVEERFWKREKGNQRMIIGDKRMGTKLYSSRTGKLQMDKMIERKRTQAEKKIPPFDGSALQSSLACRGTETQKSTTVIDTEQVKDHRPSAGARRAV